MVRTASRSPTELSFDCSVILRFDIMIFSQATQLVELDREVATGLRKLEEELPGEGDGEIKDLSESKAEGIDTGGNDTNQETKKEDPND